MVVDGKEMLKSTIGRCRAPMANDEMIGSWQLVSQTGKEYGNFVATEFYSTGINQLSYYPIHTRVSEVDGNVYVNIRQIIVWYGKSI